MSNHLTRLVPQSIRVALAHHARRLAQPFATPIGARGILLMLFAMTGFAMTGLAMIAVSFESEPRIFWLLFGVSQGLFAAFLIDVLLWGRTDPLTVMNDQRVLLGDMQASNESLLVLVADMGSTINERTSELAEANDYRLKYMELLGTGLIHVRRMLSAAGAHEDATHRVVQWAASVEHEFDKLAHPVDPALTAELEIKMGQYEASLDSLSNAEVKEVAADLDVAAPRLYHPPVPEDWECKGIEVEPGTYSGCTAERPGQGDCPECG